MKSVLKRYPVPKDGIDTEYEEIMDYEETVARPNIERNTIKKKIALLT